MCYDCVVWDRHEIQGTFVQAWLWCTLNAKNSNGVYAYTVTIMCSNQSSCANCTPCVLFVLRFLWLFCHVFILFLFLFLLFYFPSLSSNQQSQLFLRPEWQLPVLMIETCRDHENNIKIRIKQWLIYMIVFDVLITSSIFWLRDWIFAASTSDCPSFNLRTRRKN